MFIVFIPVFYFLYLPTRLAGTVHSLRQSAQVQWGLMATVFCVSHAAYLLVLDTAPVGGAGLMLYVMFLTEMGEAVRLLASASNARLLVVLGLSLAVGGGLAPWVTPLIPVHGLLCGFVLGLGGEIGSHRLQELRLALHLEEGPLPPGQGGGLIRVIALTYTAPLFFHGFRYFYLP
jgi:phosphatidate cytidylyltransferase